MQRRRSASRPASLSGDEEARLTFAGATARRDGDESVLVIDIGGGSTELVLGCAAGDCHVSTQIGVVRHSERHLHTDPPTPRGARRARATTCATSRRTSGASRPTTAIAVAGTPTQCAAIDLGLEHYDPARIEGHVLTAQRLRELLDRAGRAAARASAAQIRGLDPARAPVIVAGIAILLEVVRSLRPRTGRGL